MNMEPPSGTTGVGPLLPIALAILLGLAGWALGQRGRGFDPELTARMNPASYEGGHERIDEWGMDADFPEDVFTFVRLRHQGNGIGYHKWTTDYPKAERNFTARLHQLTSIRVNPVYRTLEIDDPELFKYPFVFMANPRNIELTDEHADALRKYLNNGGFILVDDIWGDGIWSDMERAMDKVFPGKKPRELDLSHPIFNAVFQLDKIPQVPSHDSAEYWMEVGEDKHYEIKGFEDEPEESMNTPHFQAWFDDNGRMMVLVNHNNDIADGWEEEDYAPWFFKKYSEKYCFPIGINIIFYALTN